MTPHARMLYDAYPDERRVLLDWQYYDLSRVWPLVETMLEEYHNQDYPAFISGDLPATKVCLAMGEIEVIAWADQDIRFVDLVQAAVILEMRKNAKAKVEHLFRQHPKWQFRTPTEAEAFANKLEDTRRAIDEKSWEPQKARVGEIVSSEKDAALIRVASCACDLISQQNLFFEVDGSMPRSSRRRVLRDNGVLPVHRVIDFARSETIGHRIKSDGHRKALHFCSGHWRRSEGPRSRVVNGARRTWIDGHWRGDPALGVVTKTYVTGRKFLQAIADANRLSPTT